MQTQRPRKALLVFTALVAVALSLSMVGSTFANLSGSTFEGSDGNLVVNTSGNTDWANVAGLNTGIDKPTGKTDNSFGQGTKEDDPAVTVVTGSIPPNKNDLTRFYEASEVGSNGHNYLYLGWERLVNIGNANLDFEINQKKTTAFTTDATGPITLNRTAGDLLVTYDFSGSGTPTLGLNFWLTGTETPTPSTASQCFSSNALPCWGKHVDLTGNAEGAVNTATISEPIAGGSLTAGLFGEAAIDLTAAGVFPAGTCEAFGSTFVKSRSSSSFTAEIKDFIAPIPVNISNCGTINIIKDAVPNDAQDFSYSTTGGLTPSTFKLDDDSDPTLSNTQTYTNVQPGSYTVTEASTTGWDLTSLVCTATGTGTSAAQDSTTPSQANITIAAGGVATCTYTNTEQLGAIKITKTSTKGNTALAGATFSITKGGTAITGSPFTGNSSGVVCVDNLAFGDYVVTETGAPTGYNIDDKTGHTVTVNNNAKCSDTTYGGESISFSDTPLSSIQVKFSSLAGAGVTKASIVCKDGAGAVIAAVSENGSADPAFDDTDETFTNLPPNTTGQSYTCLVVVDP